jgi:hypothetical protein
VCEEGGEGRGGREGNGKHINEPLHTSKHKPATVLNQKLKENLNNKRKLKQQQKTHQHSIKEDAVLVVSFVLTKNQKET